MSRPLVLTVAVAIAALLAAPAVAVAQPAAFKPCPFTPAELQAALGVSFAAGTSRPPLEAGTLKMHSCRYESKNYTLQVTSQVYANPADARKATMILAGTLVPIPRDPDGAVYQEGQGDNTDPAVHYARNGVATELRVMGLYYTDRSKKTAAMVALREKLARLRRVP
ncbi:MAG: hypothetical protein MUF21_01435 [Gemmatimonadaceae bacterium]|jgi:hypothetical protein|nr:hypothetical protein [Gemmatimonadaceae bacterium]